MLHLAAPCCAMARLLEGSRLRLPGRCEQRPSSISNPAGRVFFTKGATA